MSFTAFDRTELEQYKAEAKERWGHTEAYQESERRTPSADATQQMMDIFRQFGEMRHLSPECEEVQTLTAELQQHITENYYACTKEIFRGLGGMYVGDERFRRNIDDAGGAGTAAFAAQAIAIYCGR